MLRVPYRRQATDDTCGPACLLMCLLYRQPATRLVERDLARRCQCLPDLGCAVKDVFSAARDLELGPVWLEAARIEEEVAASLGSGNPIVATVELRHLPYLADVNGAGFHSVVIVGAADGDVVVHDPAPSGGFALRIPRVHFLSRWDDRLFTAYACAGSGPASAWPRL